jgi:hypothetical protein
LERFTEEYLLLVDVVKNLEEQNMELMRKNFDLDQSKKKYRIDSLLLEELIDKNINLFEENNNLKERIKIISKENIELITINNQYIEAIKLNNEEFGKSKIKHARQISRVINLEKELLEEKENNLKAKKEMEDIKTILQKQLEERINAENHYQDYILRKEGENLGLKFEIEKVQKEKIINSNKKFRTVLLSEMPKHLILADMMKIEENDSFDIHNQKRLRLIRKRNRSLSEKFSKSDLKNKFQEMNCEKKFSNDEIIKNQSINLAKKLLYNENHEDIHDISIRNKISKTLNFINDKSEVSQFKNSLEDENSFSNYILNERRKTYLEPIIKKLNLDTNTPLDKSIVINKDVENMLNFNRFDENSSINSKNLKIKKISDLSFFNIINKPNYSQDHLESFNNNIHNSSKDWKGENEKSKIFQFSNLDINMDKHEQNYLEENNENDKNNFSDYKDLSCVNSFRISNIFNPEDESKFLIAKEKKENFNYKKDSSFSNQIKVLSEYENLKINENNFVYESPKIQENSVPIENQKNFILKRTNEEIENDLRKFSTFSNISEINNYLYEINPSSNYVLTFENDENNKNSNQNNPYSSPEIIKKDSNSFKDEKDNNIDYEVNSYNNNIKIENIQNRLLLNMNKKNSTSFKNQSEEDSIISENYNFNNFSLARPISFRESKVKTFEKEETLTSELKIELNKKDIERKRSISTNFNTLTKNVFAKFSAERLNEKLNSSNLENLEDYSFGRNINNKSFLSQLKDKKRGFISCINLDFLKKKYKSDKTVKPKEQENINSPPNFNISRERILNEIISKINLTKTNKFSNLCIVNRANDFSIFNRNLNNLGEKNEEINKLNISKEISEKFNSSKINNFL